LNSVIDIPEAHPSKKFAKKNAILTRRPV